MKKLLIILFAVMFIVGGTPVFATNIEFFDETDLGAKIDAPNLILKKGNHSIGAEVSINDITRDWDLGSQAYIKYTFNGCFLLCDK